MARENDLSHFARETDHLRATLMTGNSSSSILDPSAPYDSALAFRENYYIINGKSTLVYHAGQFFAWTGTHYRPVDLDTIRAHVYSFFDSADCPDKQGGITPFKATSRRVTDTVDALKAMVNLPASGAVAGVVGIRVA